MMVQDVVLICQDPRIARMSMAEIIGLYVLSAVFFETNGTTRLS